SRGKPQIVVIGLSVSNKLLQVLGRKIFSCNEYERLLGDKSNWNKICYGVIAGVLIECLISCESACTAQYRFVPIGSSSCYAARAIHTASATHVLDHELLPEHFGKMGADYAGQNIVTTSGRKGDNQRNGTRRPILGERIAKAKCTNTRERHHEIS